MFSKFVPVKNLRLEPLFIYIPAFEEDIVRTFVLMSKIYAGFAKQFYLVPLNFFNKPIVLHEQFVTPKIETFALFELVVLSC